jgi:hypothetical protein
MNAPMESFSFSRDEMRTIAATLGVEPTVQHGDYLFTLSNAQTRQALILNISSDMNLGETLSGENPHGSLIIAQTQHGYFELHNCTAFMVFEPDELIFLSATGDAVSGLVVGKECTCSMFTNVRRSNLSANFAELDPRLLMSAMQLSVAEALLVV